MMEEATPQVGWEGAPFEEGRGYFAPPEDRWVPPGPVLGGSSFRRGWRLDAHRPSFSQIQRGQCQHPRRSLPVPCEHFRMPKREAYM